MVLNVNLLMGTCLWREVKVSLGFCECEIYLNYFLF